MKNNIDIFIFLDALGWEVIKDTGFVEDILPYRYRVGMQFGYSSTAIPTIMTGQPPSVHKHLCFYYYAPERSPFKMFKLNMLKKGLPHSAFDRPRPRHIISKCLAMLRRYSGFFEMYAMPFERLPYFDYIEKTDIFAPHGLAPVRNLADLLVERKLKWHMSDWRLPEKENFRRLLKDLRRGRLDFAFLYAAELDAILHWKPKSKRAIVSKLQWYSNQIARIAEVAAAKYDCFTLHVMSDHGMTKRVGTLNVKKLIEQAPFEFGKDYVATYDSTMARIWFFNDKARTEITEIASDIPYSHILSREEKEHYGVYFPDNMYGELMLLLDPGYQIEPCDMGHKSLPGMHGYAPEHEDSYACFLSSEYLENPPLWVGDYFTLMKEKILAASWRKSICPVHNNYRRRRPNK